MTTSQREKIRTYYEANLAKAQKGIVTDYTVWFYMVSHRTLLIAIRVEAGPELFLEFSGVTFARFLPRWKDEKIIFLAPDKTTDALNKLGIEGHYICCAGMSEPSFFVAFSIFRILNERPEYLQLSRP